MQHMPQLEAVPELVHVQPFLFPIQDKLDLPQLEF